MSEVFAPQVRELPPLGMVTIRGDLSDPAFAAALSRSFGIALPAPRGISAQSELELAWMSPDELLLLCPRADVAGVAERLEVALAGQFATVAEVSDARTCFEISGPGAREVLAKLTPADLHPDIFGPGQMRRTRLAQVAAALWMPDADRIRLICFRSVAQYVHDLLTLSAALDAPLRVFPG